MSQPVQDGAQPPKKKGGCMGCSWACILPAGCLVILMIGCTGAVGYIFAWPYYTISNSKSYAEAVDRAKNDARVKAALGDPVSAGFMSTVKVDYTKSEYTFVMSLKGSKGNGTLYAVSKEVNGTPDFSELRVEAGEKEINLLGSF
jgi:hypothetical protein